MSSLSKTKAPRNGRDHSLREEQTFCRQALESGAYNTMTDKEWVEVCERVATEARKAAEEGRVTSAL